MDEENTENAENTENTPNSSNRIRLVLFCIALILVGISALILYLLFRPSKPYFSVASVWVYALTNNVSSSQSSNLLCTSMQFNFVLNNPNDRVGIFYDRLSVSVYYHNEPIAPPVALPSIFQKPSETGALSQALGAPIVPVSEDAVTQLTLDQANGVVGLKVVVLGQVKYKSTLYKTGWSMLYVTCDLVVGLKKGGTSTTVPLLSNPECLVET
ncbi:hypothetical protein LUZ62_035057 [Rhynchospora pubera]|uniref:Late embryogenesis abundant protein LEA-2 subgroup domain-containing protein n=1 Tax=Rhynchospora pubera TaxID=906938 RepID=A0AAV8EY42_9POAL|nr:hypothetical protein LUZ62_035057 [Rhynchospora pubera]